MTTPPPGPDAPPVGVPLTDGWIEWTGGENPVPGQMVEIKCRDGSTGTEEASFWNWNSEFSPIIAYRPAPQSEAPAEHGGERAITGGMARAAIRALRKVATVDVGYMDEPMMRSVILAALQAAPAAGKVVSIPPMTEDQRAFIDPLINPAPVDLSVVVGGPRQAAPDPVAGVGGAVAWRMVPVEPTEAMIRNGCIALEDAPMLDEGDQGFVDGYDTWRPSASQTYAAMLAASRPPPAVSVEEVARWLLDARFSGWEDRDAGDEWKGSEALDIARRDAAELLRAEDNRP